MPRNELAQHMQEFTQMHMRYMAEFLRSQTLNGSLMPSVSAHSSSDERGASSRAADSCQCKQELINLRETVLELEGRLVRQDQQIRELCIHNETQKNQVTELRRKLSSLEEATRELEAQQYQGIYVWRLENFSLHLRNQEAGQPIVLHSPPFTRAGRGTNSVSDCICKPPAPLAVPTTSRFSCTLCRVSLTASSPGPSRVRSDWRCWTRSRGSTMWR